MTAPIHVPLDELERFAFEAGRGAEVEFDNALGKAFLVVGRRTYVADLPAAEAAK